MKIAFVVNNYPPRVGGVEAHVSSLAGELFNRGHTPIVYTLSSPPEITSQDGIEVISLREHLRVGGVLGFPSFGTKRFLKSEIKTRGIEIVSTHTRFFPMSFLGVRAARSMGIPVIHTEHGSDFVSSPSWFISMASRLIDITLGRYVLTSATDVLGVSHAVVNFVKRLSGRTAEVFYNAVHIPVNVEKSRKNRLVFVGRIVARKGWELALEIAQKIHWEGNVPQFEAVFLGEGNEMALLRRKERSIENDSHWLHILGRVTPDEVTKWLSGAVLVNPTTLSEGFQTTLLEALVVDAQIVTYPVPGSEILISQGAPVSVLETDDPEAWTETIRNALLCPAAPVSESVLEFWSWTKRAEQYELICRGLLFDADRLE